MEADLAAILGALDEARGHVRWKPGKAQPHLRKRIRQGHLPESATLETYEALIATPLGDTAAGLYVYHFGGARYPAVVGEVEDRVWLVMFSMDGVIETAFPPDDPATYLANPDFMYLGVVQELMP